MKVDPSSVNVNDQGPVNLFVVLGQSSSYDDAKYLLSQLNTSLSQIGEHIAPFKQDMISAIHAHVNKKSAINQQYVITHSNESTFEFSLLINITLSQFKQSFKQFLQSEHKQKYFLNLTFDSNYNGDMNINDSLVSCDDIHSYLTLYHVNAQNIDFIMNQKVFDSNKNWKLLEKLANVSVRPIQSLLNQGEYAFDDFVDLVDPYLNKTPVDQLMDAPICTGTLKIQKPSLYIFPAGQGDSCYFAINGFTMLINGGFDRLKPCFWKFVNMLEQIDAVLVTHTDSDSLGGLTSLFQKKAANVGVKPRISVILGNLISSHNSHNLHSSPNKAANLIINELPNCSGNKSDSDLILEAIDRLQIKLQPLVIQRPLTEKVKLHYDHFKLYYKAHYGSLDLYLLTPNVQSTEFKDFCLQQQTMISKMHKSNLAFQHVYRNLPSSHLASSVCLLVWQPSYKVDSTNTALRLLFTGNCPQNILFNALDKLKDFDLLVHPVYKIKSDLDQNQQFYNVLRKETKVNKESASSKLNSSMSKTNGEAKNTTSKTARPNKPASAPVSAKKADNSTSKPPVGDKKPSSASNRQSMNGTSATKASKPVEVTKKTAVAKQPVKPAVPRQVPAKSELAKKPALNAAKPPIKKDAKNSKTSSSSADHGQSEVNSSELLSEQISEELASGKLNSSMSKANGEAKNTTSKTARPTKPASAPVSAKKTDNSTSKPPVGDKKPSSASNRQSMNASATTKTSKTADISKKSANAKPPLKKENKNSKTLSLSIEPVQSEQSPAEPVSETLVERKEEVVVEENFVNNVVVIENDNVEQIEQVEQVENVEVVEQVIEQQVVEHEQEVVECETNHFETDRMHDQEPVEPVEEKRADQVVSEINDSRNLEIDDHQAEQQEMVPLEQQQETTPIQNVNQSVEQEIQPLEQQQEITPVQIDQPLVDLEEVVPIDEHQNETSPVVEQQSETDPVVEQQSETNPVVEQQSEANLLVEQPSEINPVVEQQPEMNLIVEQPNETSSVVEQQPEMNLIVEQPSEINPVVEQQHQEEVLFEQQNQQQQQQENAGIEYKELEQKEDTQVQSEEGINQQQEINTVISELMIEQNGESGEHCEHEVEKAYSNESPNLSPVKKDFCEQNGFGGEHTNAPVSEDQISSVENANLDENTDEIVSGNIENREHGCKDDIMTRSFIEDASDPTSNPFNPVKTLNESCDLNRTHELFQDEESCNTSKTEEIVNGVESVKVENTQANQVQEVSSNEQPPLVENLVEQPMSKNKPAEQSSPILVNSENLAVSSGKRPVAPVSPSQNSEVKTIKNTSISQKSARSTGPLHPVYVELAFIPAHGHPSYVDADFFKRVRARHYVLSAIDFGEHILNALLDGKETWDDRNLQVTLVPTYESDLLRRWFENNQERLARLKVEITPAARHSIVTVDENPDLNCPAYKLEF